MRESLIEKKVCEYAESLGWLQFKFTSPGQRSIPDRIFFRAGVCFLIEFKAPGKRPTKLQQKKINDLRKQGFYTWVVDSIELGKEIVDSLSN